MSVYQADVWCVGSSGCIPWLRQIPLCYDGIDRTGEPVFQKKITLLTNFRQRYIIMQIFFFFSQGMRDDNKLH